MKIVIGDMSFEEAEKDLPGGSYGECRLVHTKRYEMFLETAAKLYISRYERQPQRTTVEEF